MNFLLSTLEHDPIVFIGCRLQEPVMKQVFSLCEDNQRKRQSAIAAMGYGPKKLPPRFIILPEPEVYSNGVTDVEESRSELEKAAEYYKGIGVSPIWYSAPRGDYSGLRSIFDRLAKLQEIKLDLGWGNDHAE
jgi:hypothetical protein